MSNVDQSRDVRRCYERGVSMPLKSIDSPRPSRHGSPAAAVSSSPKRDVVTGDDRRGGQSAVAGVRAVPGEGHERAPAEEAAQLAARKHSRRYRPPQADPRNRADALAHDLRAGNREPERRRVRRHRLVRRPAHGDHRRPLRVRPGRTRRLGEEDHGRFRAATSTRSRSRAHPPRRSRRPTGGRKRRMPTSTTG